ncbi:MAG: polysaccharide biosynthesis protein, partial [Bacteroidaceae bacterium]|nr:polysaccharide biosynthesis protein [Bacteroidaceae bacterium]
MLVRKIFSWIFSRGALPYWCILLVDCMIVMLSGLVSFYIIYDGLTLLQNFQRIVLGLSVCLIVYIFSFLVFHTFRGVMRYSS